jgi:hypothetical protein
MVGGLAVRVSCARHVEHAPEEPPSPLSPTKTVCVLVAATRAGPELVRPGTPPTDTVVPVAFTGSIKVDILGAKIGDDEL